MSCFNGVTPRAGHEHNHRWCPATSGPQFGSQAGRPGGGMHTRISCRPALPCLWMETSSLGAGISKVQREKGKGAGRVTWGGSFQIPLQASTAGLLSLRPAPWHLRMLPGAPSPLICLYPTHTRCLMIPLLGRKTELLKADTVKSAL